MAIYLLHFSKPYKHARHYLGFAEDVNERLQRHRADHGARLTQIVTENGIELILARTWEGDRNDERKLKNHKHAPRFCPICNPGTRRGEMLKAQPVRTARCDSCGRPHSKRPVKCPQCGYP